MDPVRLTEMLRDDPIVVTGMGVHCAAGTDVAALWRSVVRGDCPAAELCFDGGQRFPACVAEDVRGDDPRILAGRRTDRSVQLALSAAVEAADHAGLGCGSLPRGRIAVIAGTSRGPQHLWEVAQRELDKRRRLRPTFAATGTVACLSGLLAQQLGATGPGFTVSATCSSSANAIALAAQQLLLGTADVVLAGGSDAPLHPLVMLGMESAGMLGAHSDPRCACRPFDLRRNGLIVGEGAGFLVLERATHAAQRGTAVLATLEAWATGVNGHGRTGISEDGAGLLDVLGQAVATAGLDARDIGYVNAHGTATRLNDRVEAAAMRQFFGRRVPISSTKAVTGHCLGATPAIEAIIAISALRSGLLPPTAGLEQVDPDCAGLDLIQGSTREAEIRHAVSQSIGFWGYHACLILGRA